MFRRSIALPVLLVIAAGCATPTAPTAPTTSPVPSAAPSTAAAPAGSITLHRIAGDLGCDTIGIEYTSLTFHIDPGAVDQVTALTNKAATLKTYWADGFEPGSDAERVIRDKAGQVIVHDGDPLLVPAAAYPRLAGNFVCLAPDALYVFDGEPS